MVPASILRVLVEAQGIQEVHRQLAAIDTQGKRTADSTDKLQRKFSNLDNTVGDFNRSMTGARNVMALVKFPAMIAGAGMAAQAVGALAAGGVALGSALAPLSGLMVAAVAGKLAFAQASGIAKLATEGLAEALEGDKKAFKNLTPAGQDVVVMLKTLKPELKLLKREAQQGLLGSGVVAGIQDATKALGPLHAIVRGTAKVMGGLAAKALHLVGDEGVLRNLTKIGNTNIAVIRNMGNAALILAPALVSVLAAAGPLVRWLTLGARQIAVWAALQVRAGEESGKMAAFFGQTRDVVKQLALIGADLAAAFWEIGKAAAPLGRTLLADIVKLADKFREWSQSMSGQSALRAYFDSAKGPIREVAGLIGDIGGAFLRLSKPGKETTSMIAKFRTLVPVLETVIASTTAALGPALIETITNLLRVLGNLAGSNGPLVILVKTIGLLAGALATLLENNPMLSQMIVFSTGLVGVMKVMAFVVKPLAAGFKLLEAALFGSAAATNAQALASVRQRVTMVASAIATHAHTAATKIASAAQWLFNAAMTANPIGLVIAAIAAWVAVIVVAYHKSETFRNIIDTVWKAIKTAAKAVWEFVESLSGLPSKLWEAGRAITTGVIEGIKSLPGLLANAATWLWDKLKAGLRFYLNAYKAIGGWVLARIVDGFKVVTELLSSIGGWVKNRVTESIKFYLEGFKSVGSWVLNRIVDGFKIVTELLKSAGGWVKNRFVEFIKLEVSGLQNVGSWITNRVVDGFKTVTESLSSVGGWIKNRITELIEGAKKGFFSVGGSIVDWIVDGLKSGGKKLQGFVNKIIDVINKLPGVSIGHIDMFAEGGEYKKQGFARGGAFQRTGGFVNSPITLMGEEAPRHPEYVIPTNPAYRKRAQGILGKAAEAVGGFAKGGKYDKDFGRGSMIGIPFEAAAQLAEAAGLPGLTYAQIAIGESNLTPGAVSSDGGYGLWQMTPRVQSAETVSKWERIGSYFNPWNNAQMAKVLAGRGTGVSNYYGTGHVTDWNAHYNGKIPPGYVPDLGETGLNLPNPLDLIKQLPSLDMLPSWMKGMGKWAIDKMSSYIKDKLSGLLGGSVPGWGQIDRLAEKFGLGITSTFRSGGNSYHGKLMGMGGRARATDYSNSTGPTPEMMAFAKESKSKWGSQLKELFYSPMGGSVKDGKWIPGMIVGGALGTPGNHYNHVHAAFQQGGLYGKNLPYVGKFHNGGIAQREGFAHVDKGERMTPAGQGNTTLHAVIDLGRGIQERVKLEFDAQGRQLNSSWQAGMAS